MAKKKLKIIGAYENACPLCDGIVYRLSTGLGILFQCKNCGCTYQTRSDIDDKTGNNF